jgi:hypothetical protein
MFPDDAPGEVAARLREFGAKMTARPLPSLLTALAIGFLVGLVLRLFESPEPEK